MFVDNDVPMESVLQLVATLSAGLFAGAATYITFVKHPARMECGLFRLVWAWQVQ